MDVYSNHLILSLLHPVLCLIVEIAGNLEFEWPRKKNVCATWDWVKCSNGSIEVGNHAVFKSSSISLLKFKWASRNFCTISANTSTSNQQ